MDYAVRDYAFYKHRRELKQTRLVQDAAKARLHRQFDLQAQDKTMKYERPSFIVVTASVAYRRGWDETFGKTHKPEPIAQEEILDGKLSDQDTDHR